MPETATQADTSPTRTRMPLLRMPEATDGARIWELVRACRPLDENSRYANLIQADHFRETCVLAELDGQAVGWISGHMIPGSDAFFIWQVAVSPKARGMGLGKAMLSELLSRDATADAQVLKTTITQSNEASWALFRSLARDVGGTLTHAPHYTRDDHFCGAADTEHMVSITLPAASSALARAA